MSEWDDVRSIEHIARRLRTPESPDPTFERRLRDGIRAAVARGEAPATNLHRRHRRPASARSRLTRWLTTPRHPSVSPISGLAAAAAFGVAVAASTIALRRDRAVSVPSLPAVQASAATVAPQRVHFAIAVPSARRVSLVGDFNGWDASVTPLRSGAVAGLWTAIVPLPAGTYQYAFVIDDSTWSADPAATVSLEDEFGAPSSLLTVGEEST